MPTCPKGHQSVATDYCDECGSPIGGTAAAPAGVAPETGGVAQSGTPAEACPSCGAPRTGRFCEVCGHDFVLGDAAPEAAAAPEAPPDPEVETPPPPPEATGGPDGVAVPPDGGRPAENGVPPVVPVGDAGALAGD